MPDQIEALLNTEQAAEVLGAKPETLEKWRRDKSGPAYIKVGRLVRYRPSALAAYLDAQTVPACDSRRVMPENEAVA